MRKFTRKLTHFGDTKMAKSSIKFARTQDNSVAETTREFEAHYLLEKKYRLKNEYWNCGKTDSQVFQEELAKTKRKGGPKPKEENSLWEAILNLNAEHTMADVQRAVKLVEKKFNITCTRVAIHRDEGHINKEGKVVYNLHAHLNFVTFKNGRQNWRQKFIRPMMSDLQTEIAKELKMERGRFKDETGVVAMGHREYRAHAKTVEKIQELVSEKEQELVLEKEKSAYSFREYQQRITGLETENTELKKELHRLNMQVKNGQASVQALEERINTLRTTAETWKDLYEKIKEQPPKEVIVEKIVTVEDTTKIEELKKEISDLRQEKISSFQNEAFKALEAKKEPGTIKDTPKEEKIDSRPVLSKIEQYNKQISELWDNKPTKLYDIEKRIDKRWTFKDCMHWFWAQGEAKKAREERFQAQRDILNKPYDDWEKKLKYVEEARTKAIADEKRAKELEEQKALKEKKAKEEQAKPKMDKQVSRL